ncbi:MAG TPA: hypothetical protein VMA35_05990 [Candidatus Sulfopaludibacter sp.]|nr:hypothetical protein [Candidatus Sulfopaludibacter sp.]
MTLLIGTLAYHLATNAVAHADGYSGSPPDETVVSHWTPATYFATNMYLLTNAVWSTHFWLQGVRGLSATPIGMSNNFGGHTLLTLISPRHYLRAHHVGNPPGLIAFLDTHNVVYWRRSVQQVPVGFSDTDVGILDADVPPSVGFLPVVPTNVANYLPATNYVQGIGMNQDMKLFGQPMTFRIPSLIVWDSSAAAPSGLATNWNVTLRVNDSSNPEMLLIGNQLVLVSHNWQVNAGPNYADQWAAINRQMHYLSTNNAAGTDYQLTQFPLTNWPVIHP